MYASRFLMLEGCNPDRWLYQPHGSVILAGTGAESLMSAMDCLAETPGVETVEFMIPVGFDVAAPAELPPLCLAQPKTVTFYLSCGWDCSIRQPPSVIAPTLLHAITSSAESLAFLHRSYRRSAPNSWRYVWDELAQSLLLKRAQALQNVKLVFATKPRWPSVVEFPRLREAVLHFAYPNDLAWAKIRSWCRMPAARSLAISASHVVGVEAPEVRRACLFLRDQYDVALIEQVVSKWLHLQDLTLAFYDVDWRHQALLEGQEAISRVLAALAPHSNGQVLAPNLKYLGMMVCANPLTWENLGPNIDATWAQTTWTLEDMKAWRKMGKYDLEDWAVKDGILKLERQRRRAARCSPVPPTPPEASGEHPLEDQPGTVNDTVPVQLKEIKLVGVYFKQAEWQNLLDSSQASMSCWPNPFTFEAEGFERFLSLPNYSAKYSFL